MGRVKELWQQKKDDVCLALLDKRISPKTAANRLRELGVEDPEEYVDALLEDDTEVD